MNKIKTKSPLTRAALTPICALALAIVALCALCGLLSGRGDTRAAANADIVVNEVMTKNVHTLKDDFGDYADWIELANAGRERVDLSGWMVMSEKAGKAFVFSREDIAPGETVLIFASGRSQTRAGYVYHAPFKLSASGDAICVYDASGALISRCEVPPLEAGASWARAENGEYAQCLTPTPGLPNDQTAAAAQLMPAEGVVRLNEVMASNATYRFEDGCLCDYIELFNSSSAAVSLNGWSLSDNDRNPRKYPLDGLSIPANGCLLIHLDGAGGRAGHAPFSLSGQGEQILLYDATGELADSLGYESLAADQALSFDGGAWTTDLAPTPGLMNTADAAAYIAAQYDVTRTCPVIINEVCSSNTVNVDMQKSYDWIELRNTSGQAVSLAGYGLSDNPARPRKWQFPADASIGPGEYMVVMASGNDWDGRDRNGFYQTNFRLSPGESVVLSTPEGTIVDRLPAMRQYGNISCGRVEGQSGFFYFDSPTIGLYNSTAGCRARCEKPVFSVSGGLFGVNETVRLEIAAEPDALIFYTLDCSEPTTSSTLYTGPISISRNTVVRAVATRRGSIDSYTATETYLFGASHGLRVVSLVADPYDLYDAATGIIANERKIWERAANVEIYESDGSVVQASQGCGVSLNGDASRMLDTKSFRITGRVVYDDTNEFTGNLFPARGYERYRSFLLRGGGQDNLRALIRDPFIDSLAADTEVMYQASEMCVLYLNGEFHGVYDLRERISVYSICDFEGWPVDNDLDLVKNDASSEEGVRAQNGSNDDYAELLDWIKAHPDATDENVAYVNTKIDMDNFIDYMCFMVFSANQDIGVRRYRSEANDGLWRWIVFDQDFGLYNDTDSITRWLDPQGAGTYKNIDNKLFRYLMANSAVRDRYLTRFGELLAGPWAPDALLERFDALVSSIRPDMALHCQKWADTLPFERWEKHIGVLRERIEERAGKIIGYITACLNLSTADRDRYFGAALERIGQS